MLNQFPQKIEGPVITHSPYSEVDCGTLSYYLESESTDIVDKFLTMSTNNGDIIIEATENELVGVFNMTW